MDTRPCAGCGKPANQMPGHYRRVHASGLAICKKDIDRLSREHAAMRELIRRMADWNDTRGQALELSDAATALLASIGKE